jgi:hypothetical protein
MEGEDSGANDEVIRDEDAAELWGRSWEGVIVSLKEFLGGEDLHGEVPIALSGLGEAAGWRHCNYED